MNEISPLESASRLPARGAGQSTMVEQSRAVAEVQAAVVIAQRQPRSVAAALQEMREVCRIQQLAERAFFRFNRGGTVSGESVHLARELARVWGNVVYGLTELSRDEARGQSEMMAFAWDLQTNARAQTAFIVPHVRDTKGGGKPLTDMRDIYENNANMGARRLREQIFAILPVWFREEAAELCRETLEKGGGQPMAVRIATCVGAFAELGITRAQLERKQGRKADAFTAQDLATLTVVMKSIKRGEMRAEDEFPRDELALPPQGADPLEAASAGAPVAPAVSQQPAAAAPPPVLTVMGADATPRRVPASEWFDACKDVLAKIGPDGVAPWAKDMAPHIAAARGAGLADEADELMDRVADLRGQAGAPAR